jgi:hypothetical protein
MRLLIPLVLVACGSSPKRDPDPVPTLSEPSETPSDDTTTSVEPLTSPAGGSNELKCMPLIGCGCFMQCSMAFEEMGPDEWKVEYYDTMVVAKIEPYCVDGTCTDVFAVHTCAKQCTPAPLTVKCGIERGPLIKCKPHP